MARRQYLLGISPSEIERQDRLEGNPKYSAADARACLEAVSPDVPGMTAMRWWVREAFLRHVKPETRQPLPSVAAVAEYLCCPLEDVREAFYWLRTEGAWASYTAPVKDVRKKRLRNAPPREAEARLIGRAIFDAGFHTGTTLNDLEPAEIDAVFVIVFELAAEPGLRVCPGCNTPMLNQRHKGDLLGFDPRAKACSPTCSKQAFRDKADPE